MSTAKAQELPERTVKFRFPKVPDFTDAAYDRTNPEHFVRAWDQRLRESYVGYASMIELQDKLFHCALKSGVNSRAWCKDLSDEYMRRLKCPNHTCGEDLIFKDRVYFKDFSPVATPDPSLEDRWQRFNTRAYAPEKSSDSKSE